MKLPAASTLASPQMDPAKLAWFRDVISRQVTHMAVLLDDLLDISRITRGKLTLRPGPVSLAAVVDTALEAARPLIERKHHAIRVELPDPLPVVNVDQVRMSQALTNLLNNAAKYTDAGGQIELRGTRAGGDLTLSVTDNGIGVSPDSLQDIFGMFAQVDAAHRRSEGGLGIGLALTRGLVELHGGTIAAHSEGSGRGTRFTITLPGAVVGDVPEDVEPRREVATAAPREALPDRQGHGILVVDRNRDAAEALGILLEMEGHRVWVAVTVQEALDVIAREAPGIAFLDVGMADGGDLAREVRATRPGRQMALVAMTERGDQVGESRAANVEFDLHVTKPVELEDVEALLARPAPDPAADPLDAAAAPDRLAGSA
jgi:CheY-like chemotaxis protein